MTYVSVDHRAMAIVRALPDVVRRTLRAGKGRDVGRADRLSLHFSGTYTIDGEMYEAAGEQEIVLEPRTSLRFIQLAA